MRAAVYRGPRDLYVTDVEDRAVTEGDVVLDVVTAGVCGTDVRIWKGEHRAATTGRIPGHEVVGRVSHHAPGGPAAGSLVFIAPNLGCGACTWCARGHDNLCATSEAFGITLDGGFAEQLVVPARALARGNLIPIPEDLSGGNLSHLVLAEPLACVIRGHDRIGGINPGEAVLVYGAGPVGLLHIALARAAGASVVICSQPSSVRRDAAVRAGATHVVDPTSSDITAAVSDATEGRGADAVITAAPVHALQAQALELAAMRGRVLFFGGLPKSHSTVELDTNQIHYKELLVSGTTASSVDDCRRAVALMTSGTIDTSWMVSHEFGIDRFADAIAAAQDSTALKVVVRPETNGGR